MGLFLTQAWPPPSGDRQDVVFFVILSFLCSKLTRAFSASVVGLGGGRVRRGGPAADTAGLPVHRLVNKLRLVRKEERKE